MKNHLFKIKINKNNFESKVKKLTEYEIFNIIDLRKFTNEIWAGLSEGNSVRIV